MATVTDFDNQPPPTQDPESSSEDESPFQTRVSWVYTLKKTELVAELAKFNLDINGTMPTLRRRLVTFLREGPRRTTPLQSPQPSIPETVPSQQPPSPIPTTSPITAPRGPPSVTVQHPLGTPPPIVPPNVPPIMAPLVTPSARSGASSSPSVSDVCERVRKWKISFNGRTDPVEFLERICDFQEHSEIPTDSLLPALHQVFEGGALEWYRNNRSLWTEWNDFLSDFKQFYLPAVYQSHLEDRIFNRRQRPGEPGRDYVVAMQTLIRRHGGFSAEKSLHRIYGNLLPEYRQYIRRTDVQNPRDLVTRIDEFEALYRELNSGKPTLIKTPTNSEKPAFVPTSRPRNHYRPPSANHTVRVPPANVEPRRPVATPVDRPTTGPVTGNAESASAPRFNRRNICWRCGETGHFRDRCRNPARLFCSRCGRNGVMTRDCGCANQLQSNNAATEHDNRPHVYVDIQGRRFHALIDTGAVRSYIGNTVAEYCKQMKAPFLRSTAPAAQLANGITVAIQGGYCLDFSIEDVHFSEFILYLPELTTDMVLGMDILSRKKFVIELLTGTIYLNDRVVSRQPPQACSPLGSTNLTPSKLEETRLKNTGLPSCANTKRTTELVEHRSRLFRPQQGDCETKCRRRGLNRVADALSRQPLPGPATSKGTPELCALERAPTCSWYRRKKVEVEKDPEAYPDYCIRNDRLYRHFWDHQDLTEPDLLDPWELCVPSPLRQQVCEENHDVPSAGYMRIGKTTVRRAQRQSRAFTA